MLTTNEPDVAYYYDAGLDMGAPADRTPGNNMRSEVLLRHRRRAETT